jgi:AcrR family transcriptional regulator
LTLATNSRQKTRNGKRRRASPVSKNNGQRAARLSPEARRAAIIAEAIRHTAETGFAWQTRDLAKGLKIAQPLIYRYFPSKQKLIDAVFEEVYLKRWNPAWELVLTDRNVPIERRLLAFYESYTSTIFDYQWIRIYLFSGLMGYDLNRRYVHLLETKILANMCKEIRVSKGEPEHKTMPTQPEMEVAWQIHAGLFYYGVRKFIYQSAVLAKTDVIIANTVRMLLTEIPIAQKAKS